ncbi:MAG: hypothetical protein KDJ36_04045 [Hyphomicrobiaceae bacterium]|nr:hypothetical protein [Hyphomicrobiaceae bacterium]
MTEEETRALLRNQAICYSAFDRLQDIEPEPFDDMAVVQRLTDGPVEIQWITFPDQPGVAKLRILYAGVESFVACEFSGCVEIDHVDTATLPEWLPIVLRGSQFEDEIAEHVAACIQRRERLN